MYHTIALRRKWELTLALTLFFVVCYAAFCGAQQEKLSQEVLRLRVVANSDTDVDQAIKLRVRDRVLTVVQPLQAQATDQQDMRNLCRRICRKSPMRHSERFIPAAVHSW